MIRLLRTAAPAAALLLSVAAASAADLPAYEAAPMVAVPSFSWTGFYVGANAGYIWGDRDIRTSGRDAATRLNVQNRLRTPRTGIDGDGFTIGGQLGYNVQLDNSPMVFGVEADFNYTDIDDRARYASPPLGGTFADGSINSRYRQEMEFFGTVRGRLGVAFDRFLAYGTGGLAYGKIKTSERFFNNTGVGGGANAGLLGYSGGQSDWEVGYALGGGVEYAVTDNISIKSEYLYYDLGDTKSRVNQTVTSPGGSYTAKYKNDGHIVRAGVNYKF